MRLGLFLWSGQTSADCGAVLVSVLISFTWDSKGNHNNEIPSIKVGQLGH